MDKINYNKLRIDVLQNLICDRMIECHENRTDMVRKLRLDDEGKYVRETTIEKYGEDKFLIGIDTLKRDQLNQMGRLVEKGHAKKSHWSYGRHYYISSVDISKEEKVL